MKQLVVLPFGGALDRGSGTYLLEPSQFSDLRNVHLGRGRVRVRRGLVAKGGGIAGATDVLAVSPIRGTQRSIVVAYSSVTRQAWLVTASIDPTTLGVTLTPVPGGTLWTLSSQAAFPRLVVTDSFGKAFIAHDEPVFTYRQATKVYDQATSTFADLTLQGSAVAMPLRGIARHLQYMVGWGYGFDTTDQRNRGETLRFSLPGDPGTFDASWYMLLGQRGEPIVGGGALPAGFVAAKENELHLVVGTNPASFDSLVIDPYFGQVSANAGIVVGDTYYFWSAEGPRATVGGQSVSIGDHELDLWGAIPDDLLNATDYRSCFAVYRPEENEIEWCFPAPGRNATWAYAVHLDDAAGTGRRWTYRPYSAVLRCGGMLQGNVAADPSDTALAAYPVTTTLARATGSWYRHTLQWNNQNVASLPANTVAEIWVAYGTAASRLTSGWAKVTEATVVGASQSIALTVGSPRVAGVRLLPYTGTIGTPARTGGIPDATLNAVAAAVRYRLPDGSYYSGYTSANPLDWPSQARQLATKDNVNDGPGLLAIGTGLGQSWQPDGSGIVYDATPFSVTWQNLNAANLETGSVVEIWGVGSDATLEANGLDQTFGNGVGQNGWQLLRAVAPSGTTQTEGGFSFTGRYKYWALRVRHGGFTGADRFLTGDRYDGDWTVDPEIMAYSYLGAASYLSVPEPYPVIDTASGNTLTLSFANRLSAQPGQYQIQVLRRSAAPYAYSGGTPLFQYTAANQIAFSSVADGNIPASYTYTDPTPLLQSTDYFVRLLRDGAPVGPAYVDANVGTANWPSISRSTLRP